MAISKIYGSDLEFIMKVMGVGLVSTGSGVSGTWEQRFSGATGWSPGEVAMTCSLFDGTKFIPAPLGYPYMEITASGTWPDAYRPTKMRLTYEGLSDDEGDQLFIGVTDLNGETIFSSDNYVSGTEVDLNFNNFDMVRIALVAYMASDPSYNFSDSIGKADPGAGNMRFNNVNHTLVTEIYVDDLDLNAIDQSTFIEALDDPGRVGVLRFSGSGSQCDDPVYIDFNVVSITDESGYYTISVSFDKRAGTITNGMDFSMALVRDGFAVTNIEFYNEEVVPVASEWISYFDNTKWTPYPDGDTTWDAGNSRWCCGESNTNIWLTTTGTWATNFRPSKARVTMSHDIPEGSDPYAILFSDSESNWIAYEGNYPYDSEQQLGTSFQGLDIKDLVVALGDSDCTGNVTNIEFLNGYTPVNRNIYMVDMVNQGTYAGYGFVKGIEFSENGSDYDSYSNDTYWEQGPPNGSEGDAVWSTSSGGQWEITMYESYRTSVPLVTVGEWSADYRPIKARITCMFGGFGEDDMRVFIKDGLDRTLGYVDVPTDMTEDSYVIDLTFPTNPYYND